MILNTKSDMKHFLEKTLKNNHFTFHVNNSGTLLVNGEYETSVFLAYHNGQWYGSNGDTRGTSENIIEKGRHLFVIAESYYWAMRDDGCAEYASPQKQLSEDAISFLFAKQEEGTCLYIIDGSKYPVHLATRIGEETQPIQITAMIVIAMVRQHDPESADQMEKFWFGKKPESEDNDTAEENEELKLPWD